MREIITDYSGSSPIYAVIYQVATSLYWNGTALEVKGTSPWASYAIPLTLDNTTGEYYCDMPPVSYGRYFVTIYEQATETPLETDEYIAEGETTAGGTTQSLPALSGYKADLWEAINQWGEIITWTPQNGTPKQIKAIIDRGIPQRLATTNTSSPVTEITILNDAELGVDVINVSGDKVTFPDRINGTNKTYLVMLIVLQDEACWKLRV